MSLALAPQCCCGTPATCDVPFDLEISDAVDGSCSICDTSLNAIFALGQLTPTGASSGTVCGNSISWLQYCRWDYDSGMSGCLSPGEIDLDIFIDSAQVHVWLYIQTPINAQWFKTIPGDFVFPITLGPADYQNASPCNSSETVCDLSNATIVLNQ